MRIAARLRDAGESATLAVQQAAVDLRARGVDVIDLGVGEPDFPTPKPVIDGAVAALEAGRTKYTATAGIPELRQALAERYAAAYGMACKGSSVAVTVGAKQALYNVFMATLDPGDEALVLAPCWVSFPDQLRLVGAGCRAVFCRAEDGFLPDPAEVERAIGPRTRVLLLNSPCNPTGAVLPRDLLGALVEVARAHDLVVVSDETYERFTYQGEHVSAAAFARELGERLVLVGSFSKTYAMTGLRVGYVVAAPELIRAITTFQSHVTSNTASVAQHAALAALACSQDAVGEMLREYRRRREIVIAGLAGLPGVELVPPGGAFYAFPRVAGAMERRGLSSSVDLARQLLEQVHVAVVPGTPFQAEGFLRLSFATATTALEEGMRRLRKYFAEG